MFPASLPKDESNTRLWLSPCIISTCGSAESRRLEALSLRLPDQVLLLLQLRLKLPAFASQFFFELFQLLSIARNGRRGDLVFQRDLALGDLGFIFRFQFSDFFLLLFAQLHHWRLFVEPLHRKFVGAFHILNCQSSVVSGQWSARAGLAKQLTTDHGQRTKHKSPLFRP